MLESVSTIQSYGMEVMGGFILGFDTDKEDIFDRMVDFIQKSGIPIAMVGLLQAMPGTQLFRRLRSEGRIVDAGGGNNTFCDRLNFLPRMDAAKLVEGYREVLKRIYNCEAYYERVKIFLNRAHPKPAKRAGGERAKRQPREAVDDAEQPARVGQLDCEAGGLWPAPVELLEVSCRGGDQVPALLWRGDDAGGDGTSLPGDDAEAGEGDG